MTTPSAPKFSRRAHATSQSPFPPRRATNPLARGMGFQPMSVATEDRQLLTSQHPLPQAHTDSPPRSHGSAILPSQVEFSARRVRFSGPVTPPSPRPVGADLPARALSPSPGIPGEGRGEGSAQRRTQSPPRLRRASRGTGVFAGDEPKARTTLTLIIILLTLLPSLTLAQSSPTTRPSTRPATTRSALLLDLLDVTRHARATYQAVVDQQRALASFRNLLDDKQRHTPALEALARKSNPLPPDPYAPDKIKLPTGDADLYNLAFDLEHRVLLAYSRAILTAPDADAKSQLEKLRNETEDTLLLLQHHRQHNGCDACPRLRAPQE